MTTRTTRRQTSRTRQTQNPSTTTRPIPPILRDDSAYFPPLPALGERDDVSQWLNTADLVFEDSAGAAIAMCAMLSCYSHPFRPFAVSHLLGYLQKVQWTAQDDASARAAVRQEQRNYHRAITTSQNYDLEPLLKLELRVPEGQVISYFYGQRRGIAEAGHDASRIARQLASISSRAQATAHLVAAGAFQLAAVRGGRPVTVTPDPRAWEELKAGTELVTKVHPGNGTLQQVVDKITRSPAMAGTAGTSSAGGITGQSGQARQSQPDPQASSR